MKVPLSWVGEFVDLGGVAPERVAELLTLRTCEVDGVHRIGAGLEPIVIGEVIEAAKHPNADNLRVTKVNVGRGELLPIVCGAPNVAAGQKVAVAVPGARLPGGLEIGERKLRGETSRGMICSERELGLGDEHDGILVLEPEAEVGRPLLSLPSVADAVLEIDNKSINHRPDLWGLYGFAGELAAILERELKPYPVEPYPVDPKVARRAANASRAAGPEEFPLEREPGRRVAVAIEDGHACRRYLAAHFTGVRVAPSPSWMQRRLRMVGARPISNVVDVSNYVMFELGQPTHAFDWEKLDGRRIVVRRAALGETLVTLDGQTRKLLPSDLVIADARRPVGLAGVMGGRDSEVAAGTSAIVLESATFDAATIRRTATRLALRSEASARFEKSIDPESAEWAVARIHKFARQGLLGPGAALASRVTVEGTGASPAKSVTLSSLEVGQRLGVEPAEARTSAHQWWALLRRLGLGVDESPDRQSATVTIPSHRATKDLAEPIDLVEEIARLRGYEKVVPRPLDAPVVPPPSQGERRALVRRVEDRLAALGFRGLETYSFLADSTIDALGLEGPFVTVKNAIAADHSRVRREGLPSLIALAARNLAAEPELRLFEIAKGYRPERPRADPFVGAEPGEPQEIHSVAGVIAGAAAPAGAKPSFQDGAFFRAKGLVAALLEGLGLAPDFVGADALAREGAAESVAAARPYLHPKRLLLVGSAPRLLGTVGELHPEAAARLGLASAQVAGFELDLPALEAAVAAAGPKKLVPIPRFPGVNVDVALAAPERERAADLERLVRDADPGLVRSVELFDVYRGAELGAGVRSLAFHVELRADDRTLSDADASAFLKRVAAAASARGASLRGWQG